MQYQPVVGFDNRWYEKNDSPGNACYVGANSQDGLEADLESLALDMKRRTYQINLGNKKDTFRLNDIIFMLERPTKIMHTNDTQCISCDKKLTRKQITLW